MTHWEMYARTDTGNVRERNDDHYLVEPEHGVFAVADGMSGRAAGDVASELYVDTVQGHAESLAHSADAADPVRNPEHREQLLQELTSIVLEANRKIYNRGEGTMGTTGEAVVLTGNAAIVAHVGDSRAYLIRDGEINRLTTDHTYAEQTDEVTDSDEDFEHVLTRSIGTHPHVRVDNVFVELSPGDTFLLCTDGVTDDLESDTVERLAIECDGPEELVDKLVARSRSVGGNDNATVAACRRPGEPSREFEDSNAVETTQKLEVLANVGLFENLEARTILRLLRHIYTAEFEPGERVIDQGSPGGAMYVIVSGQASIRRDGRELARIGPGEHVGEMALLDAGPRSADVVADDALRALRISREEFWEMVEADPAIGNHILKNMLRHCVERLRRTTEQMIVDRNQHSG